MKRSICMYLLILGTVMLLAQNFNLTGAGARAAGMGGAFIGVADDATAIVWNPAGLTLLERMEVSFVGRSISESWKYDWDNAPDDISQSHFILNFLSAAYPFKIGKGKIIGALAFQKQLDMYYLDEWEDSGIDYSEESTGGGNTFTFGFASSIVPVFSVGMCGNVWLGKWEVNTEGSNGYEDKAESDFSGFNFGTGVMLDLNNLDNPVPLKLGATFKSPFDLKIAWKDAREVTVKMPSMIGIGTSFRIGEFLTLAADYEMRAYKDQEISYDDGSPSTIISSYDLNQLRIGAEYMVISDFAVIPIRAGFFTEPTTGNLVEPDGSLGDQIVGNGFSFGSGLIFTQFAFDVSATISGYEIDWGNDAITKVAKTVIGLSGIIYFD